MRVSKRRVASTMEVLTIEVQPGREAFELLRVLQASRTAAGDTIGKALTEAVEAPGNHVGKTFSLAPDGTLFWGPGDDGT